MYTVTVYATVSKRVNRVNSLTEKMCILRRYRHYDI